MKFVEKALKVLSIDLSSLVLTPVSCEQVLALHAWDRTGPRASRSVFLALDNLTSERRNVISCASFECAPGSLFEKMEEISSFR